MTSDDGRRPAHGHTAALFRQYAREAEARMASERDPQTINLYRSVMKAWQALAAELEPHEVHSPDSAWQPVVSAAPDGDAADAQGVLDKESRRLRARAHHARELAVHMADPETRQRLADYAVRLDREAEDLARMTGSTDGRD